MIYTSYFAKLKALPVTVIPVAICGKAPEWYNGLQYKKLAPKYDFFMEWKRNHDNDYYIRCFNEQVLNKLDANTIVRELTELTNTTNKDADIALLCYEKPTDFCHRHLVSEWLNHNVISCKEWNT